MKIDKLFHFGVNLVHIIFLTVNWIIYKTLPTSRKFVSVSIINRNAFQFPHKMLKTLDINLILYSSKGFYQAKYYRVILLRLFHIIHDFGV